MSSTDRDRMCRFHVPDISAGPGESVDLPAGEAHHAMHVLRVRPGQSIELFDGRGTVARGRVATAGRRGVSAEIEQVGKADRPGPAVHLAFAVPKGKRLDWLLEKATELGAASLQPVVFRRSVAGGGDLSQAKRLRWMGHCIAAAKQSGLNFLPELRDSAPLEALLDRPAPQAGLRVLGDTGPDAVAAGPTLSGGHGDVTICVGPEGGLTEAERSAALAGGFIPVRVGRTVLRIETAAVALLAAAMSQH